MSAAAAIIVTEYLAEAELFTGVITLIICALVYGRSLARAGFDAMWVRLTQYSMARGFMFVLSGVGIEILLALIAIAAIASNLTYSDAAIDQMRLLSLAAIIAFLPFTVVLLTRQSG